MTKAEAIKLVAIAASAFPMQQERDLAPTALVWFQVLGDLEFNHAQMALTVVLNKTKFFPSPAEIREAAALLKPQELISADVAWGEVLHEVRYTGYARTPEWSDPLIGKAVEIAYGGWRQACETMQAETLGVDRKHFSDIFNTLTKRNRELTMLPPQVRQFAELAKNTVFKAIPGEAGKGGGE